MGYDIDRFIVPVDEDFKCGICLSVLENPLATPCGHVFCANCVLPWVVEHSNCPLKCGKFTSKELNSVLPLRNLILKLEIKCDYHRRGCPKVVKVAMLGQHLEECEYSPVKCSNKGCQRVLNTKDQIQHETQECEFRPAGRCEKGCALLLQVNELDDHCCLKALQAHISSMQAKLSTQERSVKKASLRFGKREKSLLAQIACMQNEIHMQGLRYQKKLNECQAEIEYLSSLAMLEKRQQPVQENKLTVQLHRNTNGSLGFNIIGGTKAETGLSDGIIVSKIVDESPAERSLHIHDRIMEVNGKDLSKATHEEAVEAFKNATEPIIVQVLRRTEASGQGLKEKMMCSVGTQTELQSGDLLWKVLQTYPMDKSECELEGLCEITPQEPLTTIDSDLLNDLDAMDNLNIPIMDDDDLDRAFDIEYEDITLKRSNTDDKLGLTLCYGAEDDAGIFISDIEPQSIAAQDARLREGDQILQINGQDVDDKEHALALFAEQKESMNLVVCRPQVQLDECLLEERNQLLDDLQMEMLEQTHQEAMQYTACLLYPNYMAQDEDGRTDTTGTTENNSVHHEKDSGVGRATDESVRNDSGDEGIHQKFALDSVSMGSGDLRQSSESFASNELTEHEILSHSMHMGESLKFQEMFENKCDKHVRSDTDESYQGKESKVMRLGSDSMDTTSQSGDSLSRPVKVRLENGDHNGHMDLKREEDIWMQRPKSGIISNGSSMSDVNGFTDVTSMSSVASGPLDSNKLDSPQRKLPECIVQGVDNSHVSLMDKARKNSQGIGARQHRAPRTVPGSPGHRSKSSSSSRERPRSSSSSGSNKDKTLSPCKEPQLPPETVPPLSNLLPYPRRPATNPHMRAQLLRKNPYLMQVPEQMQVSLLSQNVKLKQQNYFLRRNLECMGSMQSLQSVPGYAKHYRSYLHLVKQNEENINNDNREKEEKDKKACEWKVKIRSDGTRYITKKANSSRDRVLKERANRIQEERAGLTTDDEAVSELKLGKYWSKEDRKKHLERARDQKRRREFMQRARMECLQEQVEEEGGKKEPDIVELSRKKMLKKKGRKMMLDDFTTVQEMMIHGTKGSPDSQKEFNPILNVTMV